MPEFLKRKEKSDASKKAVQGSSPCESDPVFAKKYPALSEFLSLTEWEPGVPRERGTFTVFFEDGSFKASLSDRDSEQVAFVSKKTFQGILDALEGGLVKDTLDWRQWRGGVAKKGKRS